MFLIPEPIPYEFCFRVKFQEFLRNRLDDLCCVHKLFVDVVNLPCAYFVENTDGKNESFFVVLNPYLKQSVVFAIPYGEQACVYTKQAHTFLQVLTNKIALLQLLLDVFNHFIHSGQHPRLARGEWQSIYAAAVKFTAGKKVRSAASQADLNILRYISPRKPEKNPKMPISPEGRRFYISYSA